MSVFIIFALAFVLAVAAKKRWLPGQHWLLQYSRLKKQERDDGSAANVEIVVDKGGAPAGSNRVGNSASISASSASYAERAMARKSSLPIAKPPRHEGPASASASSMEGSIRSALNELRSRQVVKSLCSQFEARVARKSLASSENDDEESCIRAAAGDGGDDEYLLPAQSQQLRRDEPRIAPAPIGSRRTTVGPSSSSSISSTAVGSSGGATKGNNLQAFLRRYSSNLDRANIVGGDPSSSASAALTSSGSSSDRTVIRASSAGSIDCTTSSAAASTKSIAAPTTAAPMPVEATTTATTTISAAPATMIEATPSISAPAPSITASPVSALPKLEIDMIELASSAADGDDEASNQCDSPVRSSADARIDSAEQDEPAELFDAGDWDVTPAKQPPLSPEQPSRAIEDKAPRALPAVTNSVARFQQFQLQIPANHARLAGASSSAQ